MDQCDLSRHARSLGDITEFEGGHITVMRKCDAFMWPVTAHVG